MSGDLSTKLRRIEIKIDTIKKMLRQYVMSEKKTDPLSIRIAGSYATSSMPDSEKESSVSIYMLRLPDSLRITMLAMDRLKVATAVEVSKVTGRSRSIENIHLNQLERMGYLVRDRKGRRIYFKIPRTILKKAKKIM